MAQIHVLEYLLSTWLVLLKRGSEGFVRFPGCVDLVIDLSACPGQAVS